MEHREDAVYPDLLSFAYYAVHAPVGRYDCFFVRRVVLPSSVSHLLGRRICQKPSAFLRDADLQNIETLCIDVFHHCSSGVSGDFVLRRRSAEQYEYFHFFFHLFHFFPVLGYINGFLYIQTILSYLRNISLLYLYHRHRSSDRSS